MNSSIALHFAPATLLEHVSQECKAFCAKKASDLNQDRLDVLTNHFARKEEATAAAVEEAAAACGAVAPGEAKPSNATAETVKASEASAMAAAVQRATERLADCRMISTSETADVYLTLLMCSRTRNWHLVLTLIPYVDELLHYVTVGGARPDQ